MKELSVREKARAYDKAIEKGKQIQNTPYTAHWDIMKEVAEHLLPELKDEDERIRKKVIDVLKLNIRGAESQMQASRGVDRTFEVYACNKVIAWLEKQEKQPQKHDVCDNCDQQGSCVSPCPMKLVEKQGEQNPAEEYNITGIKSKHAQGKLGKMIKNLKPTEVEPKFKQGDIIKEKETGNLFYVNSVEDFGYTLHYKDCIEKGCTVEFKYEDNYELVEEGEGTMFEQGRISAFEDAKLFLNTLEVKEIQEEPEPQFKVGDTIRSKVWERAVHEIVYMDDSAYFFENGGRVGFADQEQWELVEEPVSDELEEAANRYAKEEYNRKNPATLPDRCRGCYAPLMYAFKTGAKWKIAKLMANATEVTVHIDSGGHPYIPQIELYDYDKDIPLAKEGDKYKVVLIKGEFDVELPNK